MCSSDLGGFIKASDYLKTKLGVKPEESLAYVDMPEAEEPWAQLFKSLSDNDLPENVSATLHLFAWIAEHAAPLMSAIHAQEAPGIRAYATPIGVN